MLCFSQIFPSNFVTIPIQVFLFSTFKILEGWVSASFLHAYCQVEIYYLLCRPVRDNSWIIKGKKLSTAKQMGFEKWQIMVYVSSKSIRVRQLFVHVSLFSTIFVKTSEVYEWIKSAHWSRFLLFVCHGGLRQMSRTKAKDSCQSLPDRAGRAARSSRDTGQTLGQMALRQVDGKRKLLDAICFLIWFFIIFIFCFCFLFLFFLTVETAERKVETENRKY